MQLQRDSLPASAAANLWRMFRKNNASGLKNMFKNQGSEAQQHGKSKSTHVTNTIGSIVDWFDIEIYIYINWLVVSTPLKNMKVNWDDSS